MINLLPDTYKKELRAARTNVVLLRYNFLLLGVAGFILVSCLVVYAVLGTARGIAESTNANNSNRASEFSETKKQTEEYRNNLGVAKKILDNEVVYTDLVFAITDVLPSGVILDSVNLNSREFGTQTALNAHAKNYAAVTELKSRLEKSSLFSNVNFQSINSQEGSSNPSYPIGVTVNVTINKAVKK